jgi:hypothetical protein
VATIIRYDERGYGLSGREVSRLGLDAREPTWRPSSITLASTGSLAAMAAARVAIQPPATGAVHA